MSPKPEVAPGEVLYERPRWSERLWARPWGHLSYVGAVLAVVAVVPLIGLTVQDSPWWLVLPLASLVGLLEVAHPVQPLFHRTRRIELSDEGIRGITRTSSQLVTWASIVSITVGERWGLVHEVTVDWCGDRYPMTLWISGDQERQTAATTALIDAARRHAVVILE